MAYTGLSRSEVERRLRDGSYDSFLISPQKRLVIFSTVLEDADRRQKQGPRLGEHKGEQNRGGKPDRGRKAAREAAS
jgi:hypothetical protein